MSDDEVLERAVAVRGLELEERTCRDAWVWGWRRGEDRRFPCFGERRLAISYMEDQLRREGVFE